LLKIVLIFFVGLASAGCGSSCLQDEEQAENRRGVPAAVAAEERVMASTVQNGEGEEVRLSSEYAFEWDLKDIDVSETRTDSKPFSFQDNAFNVRLVMRPRETMYSCVLKATDTEAVYPGNFRFRFDIVRTDNYISKSTTNMEYSFYKVPFGYGPIKWISPKTMRNSVLKVKIWIDKNFTDFVDNTPAFEAHPIPLHFDKDNGGDVSFIVGDETVYANRSILAASQSHDRSNFKVMLEGSFKEAGKYEIHVNEIEVDVFKMIIEWIYTMDIRLLNGPSVYPRRS
jgi:hypothetical protein